MTLDVSLPTGAGVISQPQTTLARQGTETTTGLYPAFVNNRHAMGQSSGSSRQYGSRIMPRQAGRTTTCPTMIRPPPRQTQVHERCMQAASRSRPGSAEEPGVSRACRPSGYDQQAKLVVIKCLYRAERRRTRNRVSVPLNQLTRQDRKAPIAAGLPCWREYLRENRPPKTRQAQIQNSPAMVVVKRPRSVRPGLNAVMHRRRECRVSLTRIMMTIHVGERCQQSCDHFHRGIAR